MTWADGRAARALPLGLAEGSRVTRAVKAGELLTHDNCAADESLNVTRIRKEIDEADTQYLR